MNPAHHANRLQWATTYVQYSQQAWRKVIWSDEKKLTLMDRMDSPVIDMTSEARERHFQDIMEGGKSIMVWGSFSALGTSQLCILDGRLNS